MSGRWSTFRLAARLSRREVRRRPWRTLLVASLVALPVAGMVLAAVFVRTSVPTPEASWRNHWGNADAAASADELASPAAADARFVDALPAGSRAVSYLEEHQRILRTTDGRRMSAHISDAPLADGLAAPTVDLLRGRVPTAPGEVLISPAAADALGVAFGDTLALEHPDTGPWTVVGIGEQRSAWGTPTVVLAPGTPFPWRGDQWDGATRTVLVDLPDGVTSSQLDELVSMTDFLVYAPHVPTDVLSIEGAPGEGGILAVAWSWVFGAVALTVAGIVIAATFAAGARRQLSTIGQLAANGAGPTVLRRVLVLQGAWTGLVGVALGAAIAAVALLVVAPHLNGFLVRDVDPYVVRPADLVPVALLGVAAASVAAAVPARTTARVPVLAALAGRRPLRAVPRWLTPVGIVVGSIGLGLLATATAGAERSVSSGTIWTLASLVGGVAVLLGACTVTPGYVSVLGPIAARLRGAPRLAARSLVRQRTRTAAVVSAICASSALAVGASALVLGAVAGADADAGGGIRPDEVRLHAAQAREAGGDESAVDRTPAPVPPVVVDDVRAAIPGQETVVQLRTAGAGGTRPPLTWHLPDAGTGSATWDEHAMTAFMHPLSELATIVDDDVLAHYDLPAAAHEALDEDGIVALSDGPHTTTATVTLVEGLTAPATGPMRMAEERGPRLEVTLVPRGDHGLGSLGPVLVTPDRAETLGLDILPGTTVVRAAQPLSAQHRTAVEDAVETHLDVDDGVSIHHEVAVAGSGPRGRTVESALAGLALVCAIFVVAASLALAAAETREERDTLVVVGAPPATMRRTSAAKALLLTGFGVVLAIPVGLLPVAVSTATSVGGPPFVFPWRIVALLAVGLPVVVAALTSAASALSLRVRPVRVSTMSLD